MQFIEDLLTFWSEHHQQACWSLSSHHTYTFNALAEEAHVFTQILTIYEITYTSVVDEDDVQITIYWN